MRKNNDRTWNDNKQRRNSCRRDNRPLCGKLFRPEQQEALNKACGVSVIFIAIAGAMEGMLQIDGASLIGSVLMFCIGVNLVWGKKLSVANMLPSVLLAILAAYLPWGF